MDVFKETKKQISPCIAAKVKYALKLKNKKPSNIKKCSYKYWLAVIETFSTQYNISDNIKIEAKNQFKSLIK
jgi:hypothetical protein